MLIGWMIDIAREQSPAPTWLEGLLARSCDAGYTAVGLYLEHRFAYASAPWAASPGCLTQEAVRALQRRFAEGGLRIIPFLNTLGHMEGFIRAQGGQWLAEGPRRGALQICPTRPECREFARGLVEDALAAFDDEWVHLGGDETEQLGQCPYCAERVRALGKGGLYGEYFGELCRWVLEHGRRPCLWADMLLHHPEALDAVPRQTVLFDWQYDRRPRESTHMLRARGFDVVCCPSVHTYNSAWCFLDVTQRNIDEHLADARDVGALGVLVTTWEFCFFSHYAGVLPIVFAAGRRIARGDDWTAALAAEGGATYARAAEILGNRIPRASRLLRPGGWRVLRDAFVIRQNPFVLWQRWRDEACGPVGDELLHLCDEAAALLPADSELQFPLELHRVAVEWVRLVERAYGRYAQRDLAGCIAALEPGVALLERLRPHLVRIASAGGSAADVARLERLQEKLHGVLARMRTLPRGAAYCPAFEVLVADAYVPGDQAAWRAEE